MGNEQEIAAGACGDLAGVGIGAGTDANADTDSERDTRAYEARENVATIKQAPRAVLPDGPARAHLMRLAAAGCDVYVYQGAGLNGSGVWNVWLIDRRVPLADYAARYAGRGGTSAGACAGYAGQEGNEG